MTRTLRKDFSEHGEPVTLIAKLHTERDYFSVTGEIYEKGRSPGKPTVQHPTGGKLWLSCCGCVHDQILEAFPNVAPLVALHLSSIDGVPMHAESNGWYWLAGMLGGMGDRYHGGNGTDAKTPDECRKIFADHCRVPIHEAAGIAELVRLADDPRATWKRIYNSMLPRWKQEAESALQLLASLEN